MTKRLKPVQAPAIHAGLVKLLRAEGHGNTLLLTQADIAAALERRPTQTQLASRLAEACAPPEPPTHDGELPSWEHHAWLRDNAEVEGMFSNLLPGVVALMYRPELLRTPDSWYLQMARNAGSRPLYPVL